MHLYYTPWKQGVEKGGFYGVEKGCIWNEWVKTPLLFQEEVNIYISYFPLNLIFPLKEWNT